MIIGIDPPKTVCILHGNGYEFCDLDFLTDRVSKKTTRETPIIPVCIAFERPMGSNHSYVWEIGRVAGRIEASLLACDRVEYVMQQSWKAYIKRLLNIPKEDMTGQRTVKGKREKKYHKYIREYLSEPELEPDECDAWGIAMYGKHIVYKGR